MCLSNYIGLSKTDCNCPQFASKPVDTSLSGYFVDDEMNIEPLTYGDCGAGSVWDILTRAKDKAVLDFETDFSAELQKLHKPKSAAFSGEIGTKAYSGIVSNVKNVIGVRIDSIAPNGTKLIVKSIQIGVTLGGATTIKVWKGYSLNNEAVSNMELLETHSTTLLTNQFTSFTFPTQLDYQLKQGEHYFITYTLPTGAYSYQNQFPTCGGCTQTNVAWRSSINANGFTTALESEINTASYSSTAYGIILNIAMFCDISSWFCDLAPFGSQSNELRTIAKTLSYKAAQNAIQSILDSNAINFTTLNNREALYGKRNHFQKEYNDRLLFLASIFPIQQYSCMTCKTGNQISVASIRI